MWLTTWPSSGPGRDGTGAPQYAEHATEREAEAHAAELIRSGTARHATVYEIGGLEACS